MALRVASSLMRPLVRTSARLAMLTAAISTTNSDAAPEHLQRRAHVADEVVVERQHAGSVAGADERRL